MAPEQSASLEAVCGCGVRVRKSGASAGRLVRCMACGRDVQMPFPDVGTPAYTDELQGRYRVAQDAMREQPRNPELVAAVARAAEAMGGREEAFLYYERAYALDPSRGELLDRMRATAATPDQQKKVAAIGHRAPTFAASLKGVLAFPFTSPNSITIVIMGGLLLFGVRLMLKLSAFPWAAWTACGMLMSYYFTFLVNVLNTSANGEDDVPHWPDFTDPLGIFYDFLKYAGAYVIAFLPIVVLALGFTFWALATIMDVAGETGPMMAPDDGPVAYNNVRLQDG